MTVFQDEKKNLKFPKTHHSMFYFKSLLTNISFPQLCSEDDSAHFSLDKFYGFFFFLVDHRSYEYFHKHSEIINVKMKLI